MKTQRTQIAISTWPLKSGADYFGDGHGYTSRGDTCTSFWLSLRGYVPGDENGWPPENVRIYSDIGLYIWVGIEGSVSCHFALHGVHSATEREAEALLKALKALNRKTAKTFKDTDNFVKTRDIHAQLVLILQAAGITKAVQYRGMDVRHEYVPVAIALKPIAEAMQARIDSMGGWKEHDAA